MKMKKIVSAIAALSLVAALAVGGTLAYLTKSTTEVKNTFTYSTAAQNINLELKEHQLNNDKITVNSTEVDGNAYTILPGVTVAKDPFLKLTTGNPSYIYVEVINNAATYVDKIYTKVGDANVEFGTEGSGWTKLNGVTAPHEGTIYYWDASAVSGTTTPDNIHVFDAIQFANDAPTEDVAADTTTISVYGYAIAVTGMGSVTEAWNTAVSDFTAQG